MFRWRGLCVYMSSRFSFFNSLGTATASVTTTANPIPLRVIGTSGLLLGKNENNLLQLHSFLPPTYQHFDLKLIYTSSEDGCRLSTLYQRAPKDEACGSILMVRPANATDCMIGCMLSCSWCPTANTIDRRNPECVLFRLDEGNSQCWNVEYANANSEKDALGVDQRIVNTTNAFLQIGVSNTANFEQSGLYLDAKLNVGYSGHCDVFGGGRAYENGNGEGASKFMVGVVELYSLGHYR